MHAVNPMFGETDIDIQEPEVERSEAATQHRASYAVFEESNTSYLGVESAFWLDWGEEKS